MFQRWYADGHYRGCLHVLDILAFTYLHQFGFPVEVNQMLTEGKTKWYQNGAKKCYSIHFPSYLGGCPPVEALIGEHGMDS